MPHEQFRRKPFVIETSCIWHSDWPPHGWRRWLLRPRRTGWHECHAFDNRAERDRAIHALWQVETGQCEHRAVDYRFERRERSRFPVIAKGPA